MPIAAPAPASAAAPASGDAVSSPLPGSVTTIHVREGERVKDKQVLLVIEAMKMENEVLAPRAGTVTQIVVKQGESVETGAPLLSWIKGGLF
jgi:biotin carboxyl carrier protein